MVVGKLTSEEKLKEHKTLRMNFSFSTFLGCENQWGGYFSKGFSMNGNRQVRDLSS